MAKTKARTTVVSINSYDLISQYYCPYCHRSISTDFNNAIDKTNFNINEVDPGENFIEELEGKDQCPYCHREFNMDITFDCPGDADWMFQDQEHYEDYLAGDA